jgi:DNA repair exonuclease SbcCD ATPase subunit
MKKRTITFLFFAFFLCSAPGFAVESAPRISDREIIESLAEIKATLKAIGERFEQVDKRFEQVDKRFDELRLDMNTRFEQVDKRFEQIDKRFDELRLDMNTRFEQVDKRFEQIDKRFDDIRWALGFIMSILLALFGYIIWDRRTLMKPLEEKIIAVEREIGIGERDGSKFTRLIDSLRELSKEDEKIANVLRRFHLL